jgi:hypothetical protein
MVAEVFLTNKKNSELFIGIRRTILKPKRVIRSSERERWGKGIGTKKTTPHE